MKVNLLLLLTFIGCSTAVYLENSSQKLYSQKCSGCHRLYNKNEYTVKQWEKILPEMSKKSKLSKEEENQILMFLTDNN